MLEVLQIRGQSNGTPGIVPNTVGCIVNDSSKTGGQCTAYSVIPVSLYLTGLIEETAIVVALCRGRNPYGAINSSIRGFFR